MQTSSHAFDTAQELAKFLNTSTSHIRKLTRTTDIPRLRIGRRAIRFDRKAVLQWIDERTKPELDKKLSHAE